MVRPPLGVRMMDCQTEAFPGSLYLPSSLIVWWFRFEISGLITRGFSERVVSAFQRVNTVLP
jgi:hypothetical protein